MHSVADQTGLLMRVAVIVVSVVIVSCGQGGKKTVQSCDVDADCDGSLCYQGGCYQACQAQSSCASDEYCVHKVRADGTAADICQVAADFTGCASLEDCSSLIAGPCEDVYCDPDSAMCAARSAHEGEACATGGAPSGTTGSLVGTDSTPTPGAGSNTGSKHLPLAAGEQAGTCADGVCVVGTGSVSCAHVCGENACGPDGCGGSCGECASGLACSARGTCEPIEGFREDASVVARPEVVDEVQDVTAGEKDVSVNPHDVGASFDAPPGIDTSAGPDVAPGDASPPKDDASPTTPCGGGLVCPDGSCPYLVAGDAGHVCTPEDCGADGFVGCDDTKTACCAAP